MLKSHTGINYYYCHYQLFAFSYVQFVNKVVYQLISAFYNSPYVIRKITKIYAS
ncbi:uncharacterized protein DS421_2g58370 [Arachis hypogaea]|nr:uncharacterized protein DS421_2g58370 [Arachis hypogaea]